MDKPIKPCAYRATELLFCKDVLKKYGIKFEESIVVGPSRIAHINFIRALIVFILRKNLRSYQYIGNILNRNHSTIINLSRYETKQKRDNTYFIKVKRELNEELSGDDKNILMKRINFHMSEYNRLLKDYKEVCLQAH